MRIAIIGAGISGLYAAHLLHRQHEITIFEASDRIGGHSNTVSVTVGQRSIDVDTGFIVFNDRNYPLFSQLLDELDVDTQDTDMSFGMSCRLSGLEYGGSSLNSLYAQRKNLLNPGFQHMLLEINRFNKLADKLVNAPADQTLADYLSAHRFKGRLINDYLIPMAAAIWSAKPELILDFPAAYFGRFFANHGLLSINNRPQWKTVTGGSQRYVAALSAPFADRIKTSSPVLNVQRLNKQVRVVAENSATETYDCVVFACHSDQALAMLDRPTSNEENILGNIGFQNNETILHTDRNLMPRSTRAWAAWNYHRFDAEEEHVSVTYNMNILQHLKTEEPLLVSLNATQHIDPDKILQKFDYEHPIYTQQSVAARHRLGEINGENMTYFSGAYWGYGFHEDGAKSAADIVAAINGRTNDEQLHLQRVS